MQVAQFRDEIRLHIIQTTETKNLQFVYKSLRRLAAGDCEPGKEEGAL